MNRDELESLIGCLDALAPRENAQIRFTAGNVPGIEGTQNGFLRLGIEVLRFGMSTTPKGSKSLPIFVSPYFDSLIRSDSATHLNYFTVVERFETAPGPERVPAQE